MKTDELLDAMQKKLGITSDYALAKALNVGKTTVGNYRTGFSKPNIEQCFKWAEILETDPAAIIAAVRLESEKEPSKIEFWKRQAARYAVAGGVVASLLSGSVQANISGIMNGGKFTEVCIMRSQAGASRITETPPHRLKIVTQGFSTGACKGTGTPINWFTAASIFTNAQETKPPLLH